MLLVLDIGNTNIAMGTYEGKELQKHWRISTDRQKTGDEYGMLINSLFHYQGIEMADIHAIIISSVVPPLVVPFIKMCERYFHLRPLIVGPGIKTGIRLHYENPRSIGADRIVNVVGAYEQYGGPLIVIDIGNDLRCRGEERRLPGRRHCAGHRHELGGALPARSPAAAHRACAAEEHHLPQYDPGHAGGHHLRLRRPD